MTVTLQAALFDHLLRFPPAFFKERHVGYLMARVSDDVDALEHLFSHNLTQILTRVFGLALGLTILFSLSPRLTLAALLALPVSLGVTFFFSGRLRRASSGEREATARTSQEIQEVLAGVEVVKAHAAEARASRRLGDRVRGMYSWRLREALVALSSDTASRAVQFATTLLVLWLGAGEMARGRISVGDYVAFTTYLVHLSGAVGFFSSLHLSLQPLLAALERVAEIFAVVPEDGGPEAGARLRPATVAGEIRFEGVSFAYRDTRRPILRQVDLTLRPGETVALVGRSGTGKTTLANLVLTFLRPDAGRILLDGRDYATLDTHWLRGQIGVVHQETFLFEDTVANNIRYGRPEAGRAAVVEAARRAQIHEEILQLADGYETLVGERGARLSVGQKQRISIARAFLKDPRILILDEPTSALDPAAEARLRESMAALARGRTVLLITHRATTLSFVDRVLELEEGALTERPGGS
jgi:subfamily B ATP-binding cassette protein MsbA